MITTAGDPRHERVVSINHGTQLLHLHRDSPGALTGAGMSAEDAARVREAIFCMFAYEPAPECWTRWLREVLPARIRPERECAHV